MHAERLATMIRRAIDSRLTRPPDFVIGGAERPYMLRWFLIRRNRFCNLYHHHILRSDDDRALHDHPWWSLSIVLSGRMVEVLPPRMDGGAPVRRVLAAGDVVLRSAAAAHRLEIAPGESCRTLFLTGPRVREWGFHCPRGWRHWRDFVAPSDTGSVGRGCGDE